MLYWQLQFITMRCRLQTAKGKRLRGQGPGRTRLTFPGALSPWICVHSAYFSQQWWVTTREGRCQLEEPPALGYSVLVGILSHKHGAPTELTLFSVSSYPRAQTDMAWLKDPTVNHAVSIDFLEDPQTPGTQKQAYQGPYSKSLDLISQEPVKS